MPNALPIFSVDTEKEALTIQVRFCRLQYDGRHTWTGFPVHDVDVLPGITDTIRGFYAKLKGKSHGTEKVRAVSVRQQRR